MGVDWLCSCFGYTSCADIDMFQYRDNSGERSEATPWRPTKGMAHFQLRVRLVCSEVWHGDAS